MTLRIIREVRDMNRKLGVLIGLVAVAAIAVFVVQEQSGALPIDVNVTESAVAIHGYDPVAYFTDGQPTPGSSSFTHTVDGATFQFASAEHLEMFQNDPERYTPAYGGFCAYGVTQQQKFDVDPAAWEIVNDTLYLQLDPGTREVWLEDRDQNIDSANAIWPDIREIPAEEL